MCTHPATARRTRTRIVRGYPITDSYCRMCWSEQQRVRRGRLAGRLFGINEELARFAKLPIIT